MTELAQQSPYQPKHPVRVVTAASLFDGHDAAIHIMRRILQASGCEVIHLGHNRSVRDIVDAAIQEDAQAIAVSSYQGGHMEFFRYMVDMLRERGAGHVRVYGGGGGTIIPEEKAELQAYGVAQIFHPEDGRKLGLQGMINQIVRESDHPILSLGAPPADFAAIDRDDWVGLARAISAAEANAAGQQPDGFSDAIAAARARADQSGVPVVGLTGTGGAGKSSLCDELVRRLAEDHPELRIAVLSVDPTRRRTGGALLGDRIRMNSLACGRVFMRSLATRASGNELSAALGDAIAICRGAGFDLVIAETSGIGQADAGIVALSDLAVYVMTPEFGAQSQLEKIEMLDVADLVLVNKFDKPGALDALRDVRKAVQRAHTRFSEPLEAMPVFATMASQHNDRGVNAGYRALLGLLQSKTGRSWQGRFTATLPTGEPDRGALIPPRRSRYLGEIAAAVREHEARAEQQAAKAAEVDALRRAVALLGGPALDAPRTYGADAIAAATPTQAELMAAYDGLLAELDPSVVAAIAGWPQTEARYRAPVNRYTVRGREIAVETTTESLSGTAIPKVAVPRLGGWGEIVRFAMLENLPGAFPFTAGVFPYKRQGEDPARMFAGEGGPWRTNRRFHLLSEHAKAKRLSTAFDSVTLYGEDPDPRPDIWGKIGTSGVSIATVEDMEALYAGFDLCAPSTSVSMTINGPAPTLLAFYFHAALRQSVRKHLRAEGKLAIEEADCLQPGAGGKDWDALRAMLDDATYDALLASTVQQVRGTVQADILKEDQAQNTCIFSTEFALERMADVAAWFVDYKVRNFYSVSVSGYHIAEAGANPISQLAFTLANGFTLVEAYRARGLKIDDFAPNFSFFFSNGMDPEYAVIGRVARRIWAVAMRDLYGASERSQKLKYHVQTSGRSLHAQEMAFNDIRTTLQALLAIYDNCNSLHTNAYDEAVTTPTEESVRRALAIQLVINREFGMAKNENPIQGAWITEALTELVEEAVLAEFERISERGGVLGAMERAYQRSKIQDESMHYEHRKHSGELPIIGVNTFLADAAADGPTTIALARASEEEKQDQLDRLRDFQRRHADRADAAALRLKQAVIAGENVFAALMEVAPMLSLGQISAALYEVGGRYRRNM
ncbi:MAG: methylmalonyl-CoA mutase family protein [Deltaproteobacteria bacterium]|nr:methylmalonyl-CoA mutase family protein [Deltaproteobacteria bacterium]